MQAKQGTQAGEHWIESWLAIMASSTLLFVSIRYSFDGRMMASIPPY